MGCLLRCVKLFDFILNLVFRLVWSSRGSDGDETLSVRRNFRERILSNRKCDLDRLPWRVKASSEGQAVGWQFRWAGLRKFRSDSSRDPGRMAVVRDDGAESGGNMERAPSVVEPATSWTREGTGQSGSGRRGGNFNGRRVSERAASAYYATGVGEHGQSGTASNADRRDRSLRSRLVQVVRTAVRKLRALAGSGRVETGVPQRRPLNQAGETRRLCEMPAPLPNSPHFPPAAIDVSSASRPAMGGGGGSVGRKLGPAGGTRGSRGRVVDDGRRRRPH